MKRYNKNMKGYIGTIIAMTLLVSSVAAQPLRFSAPAPDSIDLPGGVRFNTGGHEYELVPRAAAIQTAALGGRLQPGVGGATTEDLRAVGLQAVRVQLDHGPVIVYERNMAGTLALSVAGGIMNYPVVRNVQTRQTGFLSGQIRVQLNEGADPYAVAAAADLKVYASFPEIRTAFLQVPQGRDLAQAAATVSQDSRAIATEIEVIAVLRRTF